MGSPWATGLGFVIYLFLFFFSDFSSNFFGFFFFFGLKVEQIIFLKKFDGVSNF